MDDIHQITSVLLEHTRDPAPRFILQRELLKKLATSTDYTDAYDRLKQSKWYRELADGQWDDGSWGRFHTQDTKATVKQKFPTTEAALKRAYELSLPKDDPLIEKSIRLMERYIRGEETWTDKVEKHHDGGKSHLRARPFLTAALLNMFDPSNPLIRPFQEVFIRTLKLALSGGCFDEDAWEEENRCYSGPCLNGWNAYALMMLQNAPCMEDSLQREYLHYLWNKQDGIYYLTKFPLSDMPLMEEQKFSPWLTGLECISGFSLFPDFMKNDALPHLLGEAHRLILEDVAFPASYNIRYAESWRDKSKRKFDMLLRIARLLVKC